jgi:hypothetical protein
LGFQNAHIGSELADTLRKMDRAGVNQLPVMVDDQIQGERICFNPSIA